MNWTAMCSAFGGKLEVVANDALVEITPDIGQCTC